MGFFDKIAGGLKKTKDSVFGKIDDVFFALSKTPDELYEELEEILIMSDLGVQTSQDIVERLRQEAKAKHVNDPEGLKALLKEIIKEIVQGDSALLMDGKPSVILMIGVNGVGKTTTIAKLTTLLTNDGKKVLLAAADTFRAAAAEQLSIWAQRTGVDVIKHTQGADPAAVVFDAVSAAKARGTDVLICDTAGRLHNKKNLMDELAKIFRVIKRELPEQKIEVLLVLDATTGQNALNQAKQFKESTDITGIVLTKLDGTAKGGVVVAIRNELGLPVKFIGVGEKADDLLPFDADGYVNALFD